MKRIVVIGTGYVGLPAALLLAQAGHPVLGVDINENIVRAINDRQLLVAEDALRAIMAEPAVQANLTASTRIEPADVFVIAVPTPLHPRKKAADLAAVLGAIEDLAPHLRAGNLIIVESTI